MDDRNLSILNRSRMINECPTDLTSLGWYISPVLPVPDSGKNEDTFDFQRMFFSILCFKYTDFLDTVNIWTPLNKMT